MSQRRSSKRSRRRSAREGMTLVEIMVVLVILSMIATAITISVMKSMAEAKRHEAMTRARTLQNATVSYFMSEPSSECPAPADLVRAGILDLTRTTKDPWGNDFAIACEENVVHVKSAGADSAFGTEDDVGF